MSDKLDNTLAIISPGLWLGMRMTRSEMHAAGDVVNTTVNHVREGSQEIEAQDAFTAKEKQSSKEAYAAGEHGLGSEIISQGWSNVKHNVSNTGTALKTGAKLAGDALTAPTRFAFNTLKHLISD
jgi:hypothetical protein